MTTRNRLNDIALIIDALEEYEATQIIADEYITEVIEITQIMTSNFILSLLQHRYLNDDHARSIVADELEDLVNELAEKIDKT